MRPYRDRDTPPRLKREVYGVYGDACGDIHRPPRFKRELMGILYKLAVTEHPAAHPQNLSVPRHK